MGAEVVGVKVAVGLDVVGVDVVGAIVGAAVVGTIVGGDVAPVVSGREVGMGWMSEER